MNGPTYIRKKIFGLSQVRMAAAINTTQATISRWETAGTIQPWGQLAYREYAKNRGIAWNDAWFFEDAA